MKKVLFVCMGNICRSPTGEGVLGRLIEERGLDDAVAVDSAGTTSHHVGEPADRRMQDHANQRGLNLTSVARQIQKQDFERFDLIVAMDRDNLRGIQRLDSGKVGQVKLFSEFLDDSWPVDVPDPYYGGDQGFETVIDMIEAGCPAILEELLGESLGV